MDDRELARTLAFGRIGIGASALLTTKLSGLIFVGRQAAEDPVVRMASRLFGVRESYMALATIDAANRGPVHEGGSCSSGWWSTRSTDCRSRRPEVASLEGKADRAGAGGGARRGGAKASLGEEPATL